jgi:tetratricopeptide (TPR) repeat protein
MIARVPIQTIGEDVLAPFMAQNSELGQFYQFRVQAATEEARSQIRYGNLSSGAELLERAITDASDAADDEQTRWIVGIAFSVLGQGLEAWGKKHDAIEYFNRAVDEFTTARGDAELTAATRDLPPRWLADIGVAMSGVGEHDQAVELLRASRRSMNATPEAARQLAAYAVEDGDLELALKLLSEALAVLPADGETWFLAGEILDRRRDETAANAFRHSAQLWLGRGAFSRARRALERVLEYSGHDPAVWTALAWVAYVRGVDATEFADHAIALSPENVESRLVRALNHLQLHRSDDALEDASRAAALEPNSPTAHVVHSYALAARDSDDQALEAVKKALKSDHEYGPALAQQGSLLVKLGRTEEARPLLAAANRNYPDDIELASEYAANEFSYGAFDNVIATLRPLTESLPDAEIRTLIDALMKTDKLESAVDIAEQLVEQHPDDNERRRILGSALARRALDQEDADQAEVFCRAEGLAPDDPNVLALNAVIELGRADVEAAEASLRAALERDPQHLRASSLLVELLTDKGMFDEAEELGRKALRNSPNDPDLRFRLANTLHSSGKHREALSLLKKTPELSDEGLIGWVDLRATVRAALSNWAKAIEDRREAVRLVSDSPHEFQDKLIKLAETAYDAGEWWQVIETARKLLELDPENVSAQGVLGASLAQAGEIDEARKALDAALTAEPAYVFALVHRARIALDLDEALGYLTQVAKVSESEQLARSERGYAYQLFGDFAAAAGEYEAVLRDEPLDVPALANAAWCHALDGRYPDALDYAERAAAADRDDADVLALLGDIQRMSGAMEEAILSLRRARELSPQSESVGQKLAEALVVVDEVDDAFDLVREMTVVHPESPLAWRAFGSLANSLGYFEESVRLFRRGIEFGDTADWTHQQLGWALAHVDPPEPEAALRESELASRRGANDPWLIKDIANMKHRLGQIGADDLYRKAIELVERRGGGEPSDHSLIGWCLFRLGDLKAAGRHLFAASSRPFDSEPLRFDLALVSICRGQSEDALRHFHSAVESTLQRHELRRRGVFRVARLDLDQACRDWPKIVTDVAVEEMRRTLSDELARLPDWPGAE